MTTALRVVGDVPSAVTANAGATTVLDVRNIVSGFSAHAVLHGVDLPVQEGEIAGIFGLNGAGKSVTIKVLAGLVPAWSGRVELDGVDITNDSVERRVARGIGNVPQGRQVFAELTVEQNLRLGAYQLRRHRRDRYESALEHVYERFPVLAARKAQVAGTMSGGEQASLAVGRALMSDPKLLLIDEPSAGLAPKVVEELFQTLAALNRDGLTILLVEQNVTFGLQLVHTAHLMRSGRVVYSGASASLDRDRVASELGIGRLLSKRVDAAVQMTKHLQPAKAEDALTPPIETDSVVAPRAGPVDHVTAANATPAYERTVTVQRNFALPSGWIAGEVSGSTTGQLVIGLPGLSGNLRSFDVIFDRLDLSRFRSLAFDPRGRGRSSKTPPGTYGWPRHAADVVAMADELGHEQFDLVGWSFGTWLAMTVCQLAPERVRRVVLIDGGGIPEESSLVPINTGLERLASVYPSRDTFMELVRGTGFYDPWDVWERYFDYELEGVEDGVRARTRADACWEDEEYRKANFTYELWNALRVPSLLIRARRQIPPNHGYILTAGDAERFGSTVPKARTVEVDAHHYNIGMHRDTAAYVVAFLERD